MIAPLIYLCAAATWQGNLMANTTWTKAGRYEPGEMQKFHTASTGCSCGYPGAPFVALLLAVFRLRRAKGEHTRPNSRL